MPAPCRVCALDFTTLRRVDAALLSGDTIEAVKARFHLPSSSSLTRHRLGHLNRAVRVLPQVDDDRSAADVVVALVDTLADVERLRRDALVKGRSAQALKASAEIRALSRILFAELELDSTGVAETLEDADTLTRALMRWVREAPAVALVLAQHLTGHDDRMAREFRALHDLAQRARATEPEEAAA